LYHTFALSFLSCWFIDEIAEDGRYQISVSEARANQNGARC